MSMKGKDVLDLLSLSPAEVEEIFRLTADLKQKQKARLPSLCNPELHNQYNLSSNPRYGLLF